MAVSELMINKQWIKYIINMDYLKHNSASIYIFNTDVDSVYGLRIMRHSIKNFIHTYAKHFTILVLNLFGILEQYRHDVYVGQCNICSVAGCNITYTIGVELCCTNCVKKLIEYRSVFTAELENGFVMVSGERSNSNIRIWTYMKNNIIYHITKTQYYPGIKKYEKTIIIRDIQHDYVNKYYLKHMYTIFVMSNNDEFVDICGYIRRLFMELLGLDFD